MKKVIKVGIDIRDLRIAKTGAQTYLTEIVREFKKQHEGFDFLFLDTFIPVYTGKNKILKLIEHLRFFFYKQVYLPLIAMLKGCDIVFVTDYFVPIWQPNFKTIPVFHDAFFWQYPEHYNKYWLIGFEKICIPGAKKSAYIVTPTLHAKRMIQPYLNISEDRLVPIPEAPKTFPKNPDAELPQRLLNKKYLLHIGVFEKRKNLAALIEAFHLLRFAGHDLELVLGGQFSPKNNMDDSSHILQLIEKYNLSEFVFLPGYIPDSELSVYYKNAFAYVFPSFNEGFGLPVLEAFQHEIPVLIANNSALPEIGEDATLTFDPTKPTEISSHIESLLNDPHLRSTLILKGKERLKNYSWENTAAQLKDIFRKATTL